MKLSDEDPETYKTHVPILNDKYLYRPNKSLSWTGIELAIPSTTARNIVQWVLR